MCAGPHENVLPDETLIPVFSANSSLLISSIFCSTDLRPGLNITGHERLFRAIALNSAGVFLHRNVSHSVIKAAVRYSSTAASSLLFAAKPASAQALSLSRFPSCSTLAPLFTRSRYASSRHPSYRDNVFRRGLFHRLCRQRRVCALKDVGRRQRHSPTVAVSLAGGNVLHGLAGLD